MGIDKSGPLVSRAIQKVIDERKLNMHPGNKITEENLDDVFSYHNDERRVPHYNEVRNAAKELARAILRNAPECADRSAALRLVREAVMEANAAIALAPEYPWPGLSQ